MARTPTPAKPWYKRPRTLASIFSKVTCGLAALDLAFNNGAAVGTMIGWASPTGESVWRFFGEQATGGVSMLWEAGSMLAEGLHESRQGPRP